MSGTDTKERNLCFAYKGGSIQTSILESLHIQYAEGTYCREDGLWHTRISLNRNHGRRVINIPSIIEEYNDKATEQNKIHPVSVPQMQSIITCFKTTGPTATNHILRRIQLDSKSNPAYWRWDHKTSHIKTKTLPHKVQKSKATQQLAPIKTGLEGLARELNLDPGVLDMQGAYALISHNYFVDRQTPLGNSGQFEAKDRAFLLEQLSRYFSKELVFVSEPFSAPASKKIKDSVAARVSNLVAISGGSDRTTISGTPLLETDQQEEPNETICAYFKGILPQWLQTPHEESVEISVRDMVIALNGGGGGGTYRSTCAPGFLRPFICARLIKPVDTTSGLPARYIINVKGMAEWLKITPTAATT